MIRRLWPAGILLIFNLIFFFKLFSPPSLYTSADFGRGDLTHFHYPLKVFLGQSLKSWQLPLWSDQIFGGFPVFAEGQIGALYLPNLVLFTALPTWLAFNLGYLLTFFIAGLGTFYYLQFLKLGRLPALLGATAFSFSFFFVGHVIHYNLIQVASLFPLLILFWEKFLAKGKILDFAIFTILASQSIFASFHQLTFYGFLATLALTIFRIWGGNLIEKFKILVIFTIAVIFAFASSAIQVLATLEFIQISSRGSGLSPEELVKYPFPPSNLVNFISPYFFGDPSKATYPNFGPSWGIFWENAAYFGIIPVILALVGIYFVFKRKKIFLFWAITGLVALLLTLGKFGPFFFLLELPPFAFFRVPSRFLFLVIFSGVVVATLAFERLKERFKLKEPILLAIIAITFFDLYFLGVNYNGGTSITNWLEPPATAQFLANQQELLRIYSIGQFENWNKIYRTFAGWRGKAAEKLISTRAILDPNTNLVWGSAQLDGYAATRTRRMSLIKNIIEDGIDKSGEKIKISSTSARLLTAAGVTHLVTTKLVENSNPPATANSPASQAERGGQGHKRAGFTKVFESDWGETGAKYYIFENSNKPKLAKIAFDFVKVSDVEELAEKLSQVDFEKQVIVEEEIPSNLEKGQSEVSLIKMEDMRWEIKANLTNPGFLVAAISWYPGWKAEVNGSPTKIYKANANSQAVLLQQGESHIVFSYQPYWLTWGGTISGVSYLILAGFLVKYFLISKKLKFLKSWKV